MHAAVVFCFFGSSLVYLNLLLVRGWFGALKELYVGIFICHATLKPVIILPQALIAALQTCTTAIPYLPSLKF